MRLILFLLLAACAFGQTHPNPYIHERRLDSIDSLLSDLDKRLKALENPASSQASRWEVIVADTNFGGIGRIMSLEEAIHGRFYPILSKVRSDSVVERKHGRFYCDLAGHSWAWGDTIAYWMVPAPCPDRLPGCCVLHLQKSNEPSFVIFHRDDPPHSFEAPGICRVCLTDTLAVWSYAEDQQRKAAAKKLTEYEMLRERKR